MMKHTIDVFSEADYVVLPSGSCAGMVRVLYPDLADSEELSAVAKLLWDPSVSLGQGFELWRRVARVKRRRASTLPKLIIHLWGAEPDKRTANDSDAA